MMLFSIITDWVTDNSAAHSHFFTEVLEGSQEHLGPETITPATSGMLEVYSRRLWDVTLPPGRVYFAEQLRMANWTPLSNT